MKNRLINIIMLTILFLNIFIINIEASAPTVNTNSATGTEETNSTFHGNFSSNEIYNMSFEYGTTTSYGNIIEDLIILDNVTPIFTIDDLFEINILCENIVHYDGDYILMRDLDFENSSHYKGTSTERNAKMLENTTGTGWCGIAYGYNGIFNGDNHTISNLYMNHSTNIVGLFDEPYDNAVIKNLGLVNPHIITEASDETIGCLCGEMNGDIEHCWVENGTIDGLGELQIGLLVGYLWGSVNDCWVSGNISLDTTIAWVGGCIGLVDNGGSIENSSANVTIKGDLYECGGFIGYIGSTPVRNCYAMGTVNRTAGAWTSSAAFCGKNYKSEVTNCYSTGGVEYVGADPTNRGFCGAITTGGAYSMTGNFFDNETSGQLTTVGNATGKNTSTMKNLSFFQLYTWDIENLSLWSGEAWYIINGTDYPRHNTTAVNMTYSFNASVSGLSPGILYHYRAKANNSDGIGYGSDVTFITKPNPPTNLVATSYYSSINLTWSKGSGANNTVIVRKNHSYPSDVTDGTIIYNNTGINYNNTGLVQGQGYYYRAWSYTVWGSEHQWSDNNVSNRNITIPDEPYNVDMILLNLNQIKLNWTKGNGANSTVVIRKNTGFPSDITDGTVIYNGTGLNVTTNFNVSTTYFYRAWSYSNWTDISCYSLNYTNITYSGGALFINCFDENTGDNLTFDVLISNLEGDDTYYDTNCVNTLAINASLCPQGDVTVIINATGYKQRQYSMTITTGFFYFLNAYLPDETTTGGGGTSNCALQSFINSISISNPAVDATITHSHDLEEIISVEIYNTTLYGTYGGWIMITESNYSYNTTHTVINASILDSNTTMARITYYFLYCPDETITTPLYYIRVVELVNTGNNIYDSGVENALVYIKKYINATGAFETITSVYTDANGYINAYLIPNDFYKVTITKTDYENKTSNYYPAPPNEWGQTIEKVFRITKIEYVPQPVYNNRTIHFDGVMYSNNTLFISYNSTIGGTCDIDLYIYWNYNYTHTLNASYSLSNCNYSFWFSPVNTSYEYEIEIYMNFTDTLGGEYHHIRFIMPLINPVYNKTLVENKISNVYGPWGPGYVNAFIVFLPFVAIILFVGHKDKGMGAMGGGLWLAFTNGLIEGLNLINIYEVAAFCCAIGLILMIVHWRRSKT